MKTEEIQKPIVIIGAHTLLGELLIEELENLPEVESFWVVDYQRPNLRKSKKLHFIKIDLIRPGADAELSEQLKKIGADTVIHCALKNNPSHNWSYAHELEVIGTLNIVSAAKDALVRKFIFCSSTAVYGASPRNPNYISENQKLAERPDAHFVRDKVDAERQVAILHDEAPQMVLTILRFCLIVGHRSRNYFTDLFRRTFIPTLLGYDPLMQFLHEEDAILALRQSVLEDYRGTFNIVGEGVIPLSYALRMGGKLNLPLPETLAYPLVQSLWNLQLASVPGRLLDYFKFMWVADGEKARKIMNFEPKYNSKAAFRDFAKSNRLQDYLVE